MISKIKNLISYIYGLKQEKVVRSISNYLISDKYKRIYFYHIRKAAGKSITDMIMALEGKDHYVKYGELYSASNHRIIYNDKVFVGWHPILIQKGHYYYAFSHLPFHNLIIPEDTFTFTCLRDPSSRVISYYKMLIRLRDQKDLSTTIKKEIGSLGKSFSDFLDNVPKHRLLNQLYMFSKEYSISEASERILGLSHYFLVENFTEGIEMLGEKLNLNLNILHTDRAKNTDNISDVDISKLRDILDLEYRLIENIQS